VFVSAFQTSKSLALQQNRFRTLPDMHAKSDRITAKTTPKNTNLHKSMQKAYLKLSFGPSSLLTDNLHSDMAWKLSILDFL
jgi:hypothetical protein